MAEGRLSCECGPAWGAAGDTASDLRCTFGCYVVVSLLLDGGASDGVKPMVSVAENSGRAASSHSSPSIVNFMLVRCLAAYSDSGDVLPGISTDAEAIGM